jgi:uncharacterized protein YdeI (YjbR/CyaY-like superfamily)
LRPSRFGATTTKVKPTFFPTPDDFRKWLERNHEAGGELLVGFYKRGSGKPSITWPESVDQALCFGWIDGVRRSIDETSYSIRFTPRKSASTWSKINIDRVEELKRRGLVHPAGLRAFERRSEKKSGIYSYEQRDKAKLSREDQRRFRAVAEAWAFFRAQAPWYQKTATFWVMSAMREETRKRRLDVLIRDSARGRTIPPLTRPTGGAARPRRASEAKNDR